jgi:tetratricopeptide (TPR) repeat protein
MKNISSKLLAPLICLFFIGHFYAQKEQAYKYFKKGNEECEKGDFKNGIIFYAKSIDLNPINPIVYHNRAKAYIELEEFNLALLDFDTSIKLDSLSKLSYIERGKLNHKMEDFEGAIADFSKHIKLHGSSVNILVDKAKALNSIGKHKEAIIALTQAIELNKSESFLFSNRGYLYIDINEYSLSKNDFEVALYLDSLNFRAYAGLGKLCYLQKNYDQAIEYYKKANSIKSFFEYHYTLSLCYSFSNRMNEAIEELNILLKIEENAKCYLDRGNYYSYLNQHEKALADFNKAIELFPNYNEAYMNRAYFIWFPKKEYVKALNDLNKTIELDSTNAFAYSNRSYAYLGILKYNEALLDVNYSISLNPNNSYAYKNLALIHFALNNKNESLIAAKKAIELNYPTNNDAEFKELLLKLGIY